MPGSSNLECDEIGRSTTFSNGEPCGCKSKCDCDPEHGCKNCGCKNCGCKNCGCKNCGCEKCGCEKCDCEKCDCEKCGCESKKCCGSGSNCNCNNKQKHGICTECKKCNNGLCTGDNKVPPLRIKAPYFKGKCVISGQIKDIELDDFKGKYLVLFFYPHDFSFVCPTEIIAFSDEIELFKKLNCEVVAASTDSVYSHLEWTMRSRSEGGLGMLKIPILSDVSREISSNYGTIISTGTDLGATYRSTFIIDGDQILRAALMQDTPIGRNTEEIRRIIEALAFYKKNGDVCPANWKPEPQNSSAS